MDIRSMRRSGLSDRLTAAHAKPAAAGSVSHDARLDAAANVRTEFRPIVISLVERNATILGGQEIRWGRIVLALSSFDEPPLTILCTSSLLRSWRRYELDPPGDKLIEFSDSGSRFLSWVRAQVFALRNIPRGSVLQLTGAGMVLLPAAVIAVMFKRVRLLTSLTTSRVLPFREERFPQKGYWMFWTALKLSHVVDALNPRIDVTSIVDASKLYIAPCSFSDPDRYRSAERKTNRVVFAGHFNWQKGSEILVEIVKRWPRESDSKLVLCGSGPFEHHLRKAAEHNANVDIRRVDDIGEVLAGAKVFLSLQQWDNYPSQSVLEAMLCECCIVATDVGDTNLLVRAPWGMRLSVQASGGAYIQAALAFLRLDEQARRHAGAMGRAFVQREHSKERYLAYLRSLWRTASDGGRSERCASELHRTAVPSQGTS
jgi:glycosyltransferase involved in cell wall biosynthesis